MLHQTLPILGQLWQLFEVSQILEFLRLSFISRYLKTFCPRFENKLTSANSLEDNRSRGHRGSGVTSYVTSGMPRINFICWTIHVHVLGSAPVAVICSTIADLQYGFMLRRMFRFLTIFIKTKNFLDFMFSSLDDKPLQNGTTLKEANLFLLEQILSFVSLRVDPISEVGWQM